MTPEQWRAAWIVCETASDLDGQTRREYVHGATVDPEVERRVIAIFDELQSEPSYPPAPDRRKGDQVGRYTLGERIGQGGMSEVYAAEDTELRRSVALKFLPGAVALDKTAASHVIAEARLASRLNHPNIVTVYELVQTPSELAIAMELVEGRSLRFLHNTRPLEDREIIQIGRQVASALSAAHQKGIVHRDIKPENIMVRADGYVKVLDFGLAQNLRDRALNGSGVHLPVGTVRYMAPEQQAGGPLTGASDIYSLAVVLEELGSWRHPVLAQMRAMSPEARPSADAVRTELERGERAGSGLSEAWLRRPALAGSIALASLLVVLMLAYFSIRSYPSRDLRFERLTSYSAGHDVTVAALSPKGDELAYATVDGGLILRNLQTSTVREFEPPPGLAISQLFFPAAAHLLAAGFAGPDFETWAIPLDGGAPWRLLRDTLLLALSHDRKRIAWLNQKHEIWTAREDGSAARFFYRSLPGERIAALFWSADGQALWFSRLRRCSVDVNTLNASFNPDNCEDCDLVSETVDSSRVVTQLRQIHLDSGFFATNGELFVLRENVSRHENAGFNLWSLATDRVTGNVAGAPRQLSQFGNTTLSQLSGSADGRLLAAIRTESTSQTFVADWQTTPTPLLRNRRRLTLEAADSYPHCWTSDGKAVIFESDRNGHLELFRQSLEHRGAELLVSAPGDVYMPQVTPDGKWILMMHRNRVDTGEGDNVATHTLLRAPVTGGPAIQVPLPQPLDEFRCGAAGRANGCVLRTTTPEAQHYFALDPLTGAGRELGSSKFISTGLGRWSLAADGASVVIPDTRSSGRFLEIHLDADPAKRVERWRQIENVGPISGMSYTGAGESWLLNSPMLDTSINRPLLPTFGDLFRAEGLFYIDAALHPHLIDQRPTNTFGIVSPDGKRMALLGADVTSNVWSFQPQGN